MNALKKNQYLDQSTFGSESINPSDCFTVPKKVLKNTCPFLKKAKLQTGKTKQWRPGRGARAEGPVTKPQSGAQLTRQLLCAQLRCWGVMLCTSQNGDDHAPQRLNFTQKFLTVNQHGWKDGIQTGTESNSTANESYNNTIT